MSTTLTTEIQTGTQIGVTSQQSKVQRWIFGMIIGSAPFLAILVGWMFVSLCINNLVRCYQRTRKRHRRDTLSVGAEGLAPLAYV